MSLESSTPKLELIQVADVVAREKGIQRDEVIEAMEQAIQKAGRAKYGNCLLYTSPSPRDRQKSRMPSSA